MSLTRPSTLQDAVAYALAGLWWGLMMCALQGEASYVVVGLLFFGPGLFVTDLVIRRWRARPSRPEVGRG